MPDHVFERKEQKYLLDEARSRELEALLNQHLAPDRYFRSDIRSLYYDTPDYRLIRRSLEGPVYKEKLRLRCYGDPTPGGEVFLELKKKYQGIVYKRRVSLPLEKAEAYMADPDARLEAGQIGREIDYFKDFYGDLRPAMFLGCHRLAWRGDGGLRVTLDRDIRCRTREPDLNDGGWALLEPGQSLLEIKSAGAMPLWLARFLSLRQIRQQSFSKYGSAYLRLLQNQEIGGFDHAPVHLYQPF